MWRFIAWHFLKATHCSQRILFFPSILHSTLLSGLAVDEPVAALMKRSTATMLLSGRWFIYLLPPEGLSRPVKVTAHWEGGHERRQAGDDLLRLTSYQHTHHLSFLSLFLFSGFPLYLLSQSHLCSHHSCCAVVRCIKPFMFGVLLQILYFHLSN